LAAAAGCAFTRLGAEYFRAALGAAVSFTQLTGHLFL
jgi:hypothetical protein